MMPNIKPSSDRSLSDWFFKNSHDQQMKDSSKEAKTSDESDIMKHRKHLAQILRYIATMHHSLGGSSSSGDNDNGTAAAAAKKAGFSGHSFVRRARNAKVCWQSSFYQEMANAGGDERFGILLSTHNFRHLLSIQANSSTALFASPPFSFYAATSGQSSTAANRKRAWADAFKNPMNSATSSGSGADGKACWLRLTRLTSSDVPEPPSMASPAVRRYLQQWRDQNADEFRDCETLRDILTLRSLPKAPKIAPNDSEASREIKGFLRDYKTYLRKREFQQALEPMYNNLFEWSQQTQHHDELVWGLGHARMLTSDSTVINGPLLEILMEVELARDGALLVRPREHTGVALNREIVAALMTTDDTTVNSGSSASSQHQRLTQLHRSVAELDPLQMAPGQPATYIPFLKRMTVELSSRGTFQTSANASNELPAPYRMQVTEAWCLYSRPKPSSVWARDAMSFADQLLLPVSPNSGMELPKATWALTHGPSALDGKPNSMKSTNSSHNSSSTGNVVARLLTGRLFQTGPVEDVKEEAPLIFPLATSDSQNRIAELLLRQMYPAVVAEGPPGTGKTHTIANMISAYLCQGKRVLVTSKSAPALSVIRSRLPKCVQDLCVDVSMSELAGMRQLQKTVERLANRVSGVSAEVETEKCELLMRNITALEKERAEIDDKLAAQSDRKRKLIQHPDGQKLVSGLITLIESAPWLMKTVATWSKDDLVSFRNQLKSLVTEQDERMERVNLGCQSPLPEEFLSVVAANAGVKLSSMKQATKKFVASMPLLGSAFGIHKNAALLKERLASIAVDGKPPANTEEWKRVLHVCKFEKNIEKIHKERLGNLIEQDNWPEAEVYSHVGPLRQQRTIRSHLLEMVEQVLQLKETATTLQVPEEIQAAVECNELDARRSLIANQIRRLAEDLVDAKVVSELSRTFSAEAQSALIRFSQIAGKAKFSGRSAQASKMTARQRRHRQEYLDAFDRCVRFIPTWIMTSSQISDYLPAEGCLFDLVIIDEASQSDITVLPGMLRGNQWLIVGDGKQVSPTESFISEESIDSLRAALPRSPLEDSLLPGQSFFDLCAQAYPRGRVVLSEHFRCAPEIINFSNQQFYDGRLIPLRLPTSKERLSPSLMDIRVAGAKVGKVNEKECDEIVRMVYEFVTDAASLCSPTQRTIGIISLLGDDQSRLIRGRLLDRIGPQKFKEHDILLGDPPTFQGAERDIIFLSMVCSPGSVPTQNRLMHAQRMNVALSRARDRMVLVRSIDAQHIPNTEDTKLSVIEFFQAATNSCAPPLVEKYKGEDVLDQPIETSSYSFRTRSENLLMDLLKKRGFMVRSMGIVWKNALCVEHPGTSARAALCIENGGESKEEWQRAVTQQKSIERVGWKCLRVDALSLLMDYSSTLQSVVNFLTVSGVEETSRIYDTLESEDDDEEERKDEAPIEYHKENADNRRADQVIDDAVGNIVPANVVVISSGDENSEDDRNVGTCFPDVARSSNLDALVNDQIDAADFGEVVQLDFLAGGRVTSSEDSSIHVPVPVARRRAAGRTTSLKRSRSPDSVSTAAEGSNIRGVAERAASLMKIRSIDSSSTGGDETNIGRVAGRYAALKRNRSTDSTSVGVEEGTILGPTQRQNASGSNTYKRSRSSERADTRDNRDEGYLGEQWDTDNGKAEALRGGVSRMRGAGRCEHNITTVALDNAGDAVHARKSHKYRDAIDIIDVDMTGGEQDEQEGVDAENGENYLSCGEGSTRSKRRRRLDKYARDGRWYPGRAVKEEEDEHGLTYDTDSDLAVLDHNSAAEENSDDEDEDFKPNKANDDEDFKPSSLEEVED